jgi:DNA repair protein RadC
MRKHRLGFGMLLAAGFFTTVGASAQGPQQGLDKLAGSTPQQRAGIQTMFMKSKLGLGEAQLSKVEAINLKYAQQMQPVLEGSERPLAKMGDVRRIQQAKDGEMQQVLSPEQYTKYLAAKEEMREHLEQKVMEKRQSGAP